MKADVDKLYVKDSTVTGYSALNAWSSDYTAIFEDCTLNGVNNYGYSEAKDNDFGTIVINGNNITVDLKNCEMNATSANGNGQSIVLFNGMEDVKDCTVSITGDESRAVYPGDFCVNGSENNTVTISGGIYCSDVSGYLASGYTVAKNDDDTYTVTKKSQTQLFDQIVVLRGKTPWLFAAVDSLDYNDAGFILKLDT